jgi:cbb3-type cytochrome oxidase maturation protein
VKAEAMDILYLLIPLSAVLVLAIVGVFGWAVHTGQFEDLEREGERLLQHEDEAVDEGQSGFMNPPEESRGTRFATEAGGHA